MKATSLLFLVSVIIIFVGFSGCTSEEQIPDSPTTTWVSATPPTTRAVATPTPIQDELTQLEKHEITPNTTDLSISRNTVLTEYPTPVPTIIPETLSTNYNKSAGLSSSGSNIVQNADDEVSDILNNLNYHWVEYRITAGSGNQNSKIYYTINRLTGKCISRVEYPPAEKKQPDINETDCSYLLTMNENNRVINPDVQISCSKTEEIITVPAGTYSAIKCTIKSKANVIMNEWIEQGKFIVKIETIPPVGDSTIMDLTDWG